jgi:hypothetical protein
VTSSCSTFSEVRLKKDHFISHSTGASCIQSVRIKSGRALRKG